MNTNAIPQKTILLVDDEEMILQIGSRMLEKLGYRVLRAESGPQAIEELSRQKDQIAVVIFDMMMPDWPAVELYDRMKSIASNVRFLLASGYGRDAKIDSILERGCEGFIQKPFKMAELQRAVEEVLEH